MKFETQRINDCIDFIEAKGLHRTHNGAGEPEGKVRVVATGGGAYKFAEMFQVRVRLSFPRSAALTTQPDISACAGACVFQSRTRQCPAPRPAWTCKDSACRHVVNIWFQAYVGPWNLWGNTGQVAALATGQL